MGQTIETKGVFDEIKEGLIAGVRQEAKNMLKEYALSASEIGKQLKDSLETGILEGFIAEQKKKNIKVSINDLVNIFVDTKISSDLKKNLEKMGVDYGQIITEHFQEALNKGTEKGANTRSRKSFTLSKYLKVDVNEAKKQMEKAYEALAEIDPGESPAAKKAYNKKQKDFIGYYAAYRARGGKTIDDSGYEAEFLHATSKEVFRNNHLTFDDKDAENKKELKKLNKQDDLTQKELAEIRKNLVLAKKINHAIKNNIPIEEIEFGYEFPKEVTSVYGGKTPKTSSKSKKSSKKMGKEDFMEQMSQKDFTVQNNEKIIKSNEEVIDSEEKKEEKLKESKKIGSKKDKKENDVPKSLDFKIEDLTEKELEQKIQTAQRAIDKNLTTASLWQEKLGPMQEALQNLKAQREEAEKLKADEEYQAKLAKEKARKENITKNQEKAKADTSQELNQLNRKVLSQTGIIGSENGWGLNVRTNAGQTQHISWSFDEEGNLQKTVSPLITNFEQLSNEIIKADNELAKLENDLLKNQKEYGKDYDSSSANKAIENQKKNISVLESVAKLYRDNTEYGLDKQSYEKYERDRKQNKLKIQANKETLKSRYSKKDQQEADKIKQKSIKDTEQLYKNNISILEKYAQAKNKVNEAQANLIRSEGTDNFAKAQGEFEDAENALKALEERAVKAVQTNRQLFGKGQKDKNGKKGITYEQLKKSEDLFSQSYTGSKGSQGAIESAKAKKAKKASEAQKKAENEAKAKKKKAEQEANKEYNDNLKVLKQLSTEQDKLKELQSKNDFTNKDWSSSVVTQEEKVAQAYEKAEKALRRIKEMSAKDGTVSVNQITEAENLFKAGKTASKEALAKSYDMEANFNNAEEMKKEKEAADNLKASFSELTSAYSKLYAASRGGKENTFSELSAQMKDSLVNFEKVKEDAVNVLGQDKTNELTNNFFSDLIQKTKLEGANSVDAYLKDLSNLVQKLASSGKYTSEIEKQAENIRKAIQSLYQIDDKELLGTAENPFSGIEKYLNNIDSFGTLLPEILGNLQNVSDYSFAKDVLGKYTDINGFIPGNVQSLITQLQNTLNTINVQEGTTGIQVIPENQIENLKEAVTLVDKLSKASSGKGTLVSGTQGKIFNYGDMSQALTKYAASLGYTNELSYRSINSGEQLIKVFSNENGETIRLTGSMDVLGQALRVQSNEADNAKQKFATFGSSLVEIGKFAATYFAGASLISRVTQEFREGFSTFKEYNSALTNISYTMDMTKAGLDNLGNSALQMASDLSMSTDNAMKVYQIYANMNTSTKEIAETAKPTAILSNLSGVDTSTAADQVQGILQQFNMLEDGATNVAETSMHVVDVLDKISANVAIDYAKGIGIITDSVSAAGQVAYDAGMSFEQLAALSAKVAERTREDGGSIGNALKTIVTRISKVGKMPAYADEVSNEELSNASKSLHEVGIEVYNADGSFRELDVILSELSARWDGLTDAQKENISYNVAATRQSNKFKTILKSWTDSMDLATDATMANGNAMENQEKYEESVAGKMQSIGTQMETFWIKLYNSDAAGSILSFFESLGKALNLFSDGAGAIPTLIGGLVAGVQGRTIFKNLGTTLKDIIIGADGKGSGKNSNKVYNALSYKVA